MFDVYINKRPLSNRLQNKICGCYKAMQCKYIPNPKGKVHAELSKIMFYGLAVRFIVRFSALLRRFLIKNLKFC